jgi:hypothetical protein
MTGNHDERDTGEEDGAVFSTHWLTETDAPVTPSETVVATVGEATGRSPESLRPLFDVIDPDALDRLFRRDDRRIDGAVNGVLSFSYEGCEVRVHADGETIVIPKADDEP